MATKNDTVSCPLVMVAVFLLFLFVFWGGGMMGVGGMMGSGGGLLIQLLFWAAAIVLAYFILKQVMTRGGEDPLDVLNRRYAAGEIGRGEYLRVKKELSR